MPSETALPPPSTNSKTPWWKSTTWDVSTKVITLLFAALALYRSYQGDLNKSESDAARQEFEYWQSALGSQPRLEVVSWPSIDSVWTEIPPEEVDRIRAKVLKGEGVGAVELNLYLRVSMVVKNTSAYLPAEVFGYACTDTMSRMPLLREAILKPWGPGSSFTLDEAPLTVLPGRTQRLSMNTWLLRLATRTGDFTLHWLLLYQNGTSMLYDDYVWAAFHYPVVDTGRAKILVDPRNPGIGPVQYLIECQRLRHSITMTYSNEDPKVYTLREKVQFLQTWKQKFAEALSKRSVEEAYSRSHLESRAPKSR